MDTFVKPLSVNSNIFTFYLQKKKGFYRCFSLSEKCASINFAVCFKFQAIHWSCHLLNQGGVFCVFKTIKDFFLTV